MRPTVVRLAVVLCLGLACAPAAANAEDLTATASGGPQLRDAAGRRLQLHGINLVPKCAGAAVPTAAPGSPCVGRGPGAVPGYVVTPDAADPGRRFTAADARTLAGLGFSAVRLGLVWEGVEPGPDGVGPDDPRYCAPRSTPGASVVGTADDPWNQAVADAYLDRVAATVTLLRRAGLRVLLDLHQDAWGSAFANGASPTPWNGEGAPPWATCTDGKTFGTPTRWQAAYSDPAVGAAIRHFFANDVVGDLQGNYARVWRAIARRFAGDPAVIGYELYNEPIDLVRGSGPIVDQELQCLYAGRAAAPVSCAAGDPAVQAPEIGLIPAVQQEDPDGLVAYEPPVLTEFGSPETLGIAEPLPFARLALSFHVYGLPTLTKQQFDCTDPGCAVSEIQTFKTIIKERAQTRTRQPGGPALLLTEFGAEDHVPDIARVAGLAEDAHLSWFYWSALGLHDPTGGPGQALLDDRTRRPKPAKARALARAYPLATAGDVTAQRFDPATGRFTLRYRPDHRIAAPTLVVLPRLAYPHGATVRAVGARVVSPAGARVLRLRARPGARTVSVRVTPRR